MTRFENDEATSHPVVTELGAGTYYWCQCGKTKTVPYCDGAHAGSGVEPGVRDIRAHPLGSLQLRSDQESALLLGRSRRHRITTHTPFAALP